MARLLFEKRGNAVWISHLDLMRLFQRAFKRAGLNLKHSQGFNPRPSVSIALPLSVGVESVCELLDFELEEYSADHEGICKKLNEALVAGVRVLKVYDSGRKIKDLALMHCHVKLEYDRGYDVNLLGALNSLFRSSSVVVEKKGKNGIVQQDIIPMIRKLDVIALDTNTVCLDAVICCQNPSLNPAQLVAAVQAYLPQYTPDHSVCSRLEIFDTNETIFR